MLAFFSVLIILAPLYSCGSDGGTGSGGNTIAPVLLSIEAPDSLLSGSTGVRFAATAQDSDSIADLPSVLMRFVRNGESAKVETLALATELSPDRGEFVALFDSTLGAGLLGDYALNFQAVDSKGAISDTLEQSIFVENLPPRLIAIESPDTLQRQIALPVLVRLNVSDPQGREDIDSVYFKFLKPDGTFGASAASEEGGDFKEGGFHFLLFDDGNPDIGDLQRDDGQYAYSFPSRGDALLGTYTFFFFSRDRAGNLSAEEIRNFELVRFGR
jgi:hypothetical protein